MAERHRLLRTTKPVAPQFLPLYRWSSALWMLLAASLGLYAHGSVMLAPYTALRMIVPLLAMVVFVAMLLRMFLPGRPTWTRWSLHLMGLLGVCTFIISLFGAEGLGLTTARVGICGLVLSSGLFAFTHWLGEAVVSKLVTTS